MKKLFALLLIFGFLFIVQPMQTTYATYPTITIVFSNLLGALEENTTSTFDAPQIDPDNSGTAVGIVVAQNGQDVVYVSTNDIYKYLGVSQVFWTWPGLGQYLDYSGNGSPHVYWYTFQSNFEVTTTYSITMTVDKIANQTNTHFKTSGQVLSSQLFGYVKYGMVTYGPVYYNSQWYVPLKVTALSLGALVYYAASSQQVQVFDYRVKGISPYHWLDQNQYIVGGRWLAQWDSSGSQQLSQNYRINQLWEPVSNKSEYLNQLKVSAQQLSVLQLTQHYYKSDTNLHIAVGFRNWCNNWLLANDGIHFADPVSFHTRGRACDIDADNGSTFVNAVRNEFRYNDSFVDLGFATIPGSLVSRTRKSNIAYRELCEANSVEREKPWLHLQTDALFGQTTNIPLP
jgi:hypothetical protein